MCFLNECDWYASVCEETSSPAEKKTWCDECRRTIAVGETVHHVYLQEHEYCEECLAEGEACTCAEPDFGETFDYDRCDECHRFLAAVEAAEVEAGCRVWEARPRLGAMTEEINSGGRDEAKRYFKMAARMHPDLVRSGYLGRLWRLIF